MFPWCPLVIIHVFSSARASPLFSLPARVSDLVCAARAQHGPLYHSYCVKFYCVRFTVTFFLSAILLDKRIKTGLVLCFIGTGIQAFRVIAPGVPKQRVVFLLSGCEITAQVLRFAHSV